MSKLVLGISAFYHDSAAAIIRDGEIIAAAQEERFSRKKHDPRFPEKAINYCLEEAFVEPDEVDAIVFYDNPILTWDRIIKNCMAMGEKSYDQYEKAAQSVLGVKIWVEKHVEKAIGSLGKAGRLLFTDHHMAHAASAFYPSPFDSAAIVTLDGVGEWETTTVGVGRDRNIEIHEVINYPHSLGLLYSTFTYFCGFKVNSGEYKLMGLAPYGTASYANTIRENLIDIRPDGSFRLNTEYFGYLDTLEMTNERFHELFGGPPRQPESPITRRETDLAASVQEVLEDVVLRICSHTRRQTGEENLVLAGGVALNCVANGKILRRRVCERIWIQPAAGDAGGALGAALLATHAYFDLPRKRTASGRDSQKGSFLGPAYTTREIIAFLERRSLPFHRIADEDLRLKTIATALANGKIVAYFAGRMEFGPRALGARSILGDPRDPKMQSSMNLRIKFRESFRPFAPSVLWEDVSRYFELDVESPYMLLVADVKPERRTGQGAKNTEKFSDLACVINQVRSDIPAVTHVDYTARIQTVHPADKPDYYKLIRAFKDLTGYGILVNTSFNVRGEPIVCTPRDAYACFMRTDIDLLVMEECMLYKNEQPPFLEDRDWRTEYELD